MDERYGAGGIAFITVGFVEHHMAMSTNDADVSIKSLIRAMGKDHSEILKEHSEILKEIREILKTIAEK